MYTFTIANHRRTIADPQTGEGLDVYSLLFELEFPVTLADTPGALPIRDAYTIEVLVDPFAWGEVVIPIEFICGQVSNQLFENGVQIEAAVRQALEDLSNLEVVPDRGVWIAG